MKGPGCPRLDPRKTSITLDVRWPSLRRHLSSTTGAFVLGLVFGSLPEDEAQELMASLETLCRLASFGWEGHVLRALREAQLLDLPDPKPRARPTPATEKRDLLVRAGWHLVPSGTPIPDYAQRRKAFSGVANPPKLTGIDLFKRNAQDRIDEAVTIDSAWASYRRKNGV